MITETLIAQLEGVGWTCERLAAIEPLPVQVFDRYPTLPADYRLMIEGLGRCMDPTRSAWLVTTRVLSGTAGIDFAWNDCERQSLEAAEGDEALVNEIVTFWDRHYPLLFSVKGGYAYFAIDLQTKGVVVGFEPEYERPLPLAPSVSAAFELIASRSARVGLYV